MQTLWNERSPPLPPFHALPRPGSFGPTAGSSKDVDKHKPKRIKITSSLAGPSTSTPAPMRTSVKPRLMNMGAGPSTPATPSITLRLGSKAAPAPTPAPVFYLTEPRAPQEGGDEAVPSSVRKRARDDSPGSLAAAGGVPQESRKERKAREKAAKQAAKAAAKEKDEEEGDGGEGSGASFPGIPDEDSGWMGGDTVSRLSFFAEGFRLTRTAGSEPNSFVPRDRAQAQGAYRCEVRSELRLAEQGKY